jgi:hypothetical protein
MTMPKHLFVAFCFVAVSVAAQPLLRYDFTNYHCADQNTFPNLGSTIANNTIDLSLIRNATTTTCSSGMGIETLEWYKASTPPASYLYGSGSVEPLLTRLEESNQTAGITLSFWIQPLRENGGGRTPLLTVGSMVNETTSTTTSGSKSNSSSHELLTECDIRQVDLQLSLDHNVLELLYRTSDVYFEPCQRIRFTDLPLLLMDPQHLYHVAIVLGDNHQQVFVNGQPSIIVDEPFDNSLQHWNQESVLHFFSHGRQNLPWHGRMYQFSLHAERWDQTIVQATMSRGLPPSKPYALSKQVRMNEDAEILPGNHTVEWYEQPRTYDPSDDLAVPIIELSVGFFDDEVEAFLESLSLNDHEAPPQVFVYITEFPRRGDLYQVDGTKLLLAGNDDDDTAIILLQDPRLVFVPAHNEYSELPGSTYASLEYCVTLQEIFTASQCDSLATIAIIVDPANDPPNAIVGRNPYVIHEGIYEEPYALRLGGIDIDQGDLITAVQITSAPKLGYLFLSVSTRREDGLSHGTLLSDLSNYTVSGNEAYVEYRYVGESNQVVRGSAVTDSFRFRVRDSNGRWSEEEVAFIQVISSVVAISSTLISIQEGETTTSQLQGVDESGLNRAIGFYLEAVPTRMEGSLIDSSNDEMLSKSSVLASREGSPHGDGVNVTLVPAAELCSAGSHANVSFNYRVVAFGNDGHIISASSVVEQWIQIKCKRDPLHIAVTQEKYTIHAFDAFMDDPCSGYMYNASDLDPEACPTVAIITDIHVRSDTTHAELALVKITSGNGLLTINRDHRRDIRPLEDQEEMRPSIKFLAPPHKLNDVFSHLHYQSETVGNDEIQIVIMYGNCESNETFWDHEVNNSSPECHITVQNIGIEVLPNITEPPELLFDTFPWAPLPFTFIMLLLLKVKGKAREVLAVKEEEEPQKEEESTGATVTDDSETMQWRQFYDEESGFYYYQNMEDGSITWEPPPLDEEFIPAEEDEELDFGPDN